MGCKPESGGCERWKIEPFIQHINENERRNYQHKMCLDVIYRDRPQPEALYRDESIQENIVIEHKTLMWPPEYAEQHQADHYFIECLNEKLNRATCNNPYIFRYYSVPSISRDKLKHYAESISSKILNGIGRMNDGDHLKSKFGSLEFTFLRQYAWERDTGVPSKGLCVEIISTDGSDELLPHCLPRKLTDNILKCLGSTAKKFKDYSGARRVLLVDCFGDLRYQSFDWWEQVFKLNKPPDEIGEIWSGSLLEVTPGEEKWFFEKFFPILK